MTTRTYSVELPDGTEGYLLVNLTEEGLIVDLFTLDLDESVSTDSFTAQDITDRLAIDLTTLPAAPWAGLTPLTIDLDAEERFILRTALVNSNISLRNTRRTIVEEDADAETKWVDASMVRIDALLHRLHEPGDDHTVDEG